MQKSMTVRNGRGSRRHNVRAYKNMPDHIDPQLTRMNETLVDVPLWKFYRDTFQPVIDEYNARQKRADRKLPDAMQYLKEIQAETGDKARKPYYETFVQIGDKNDTGIKNCEKEKSVLKKFIKEWDKRNPNMRLIGAYIHADEQNGTVHAHIDWVPIGTNYQRGMKIQNGLKRALKQQGFEGTSRKFNAYLGWQESERAALAAIAREYGIERKETKQEHRDWLDKETYIAEQKLQEQLDRIAVIAEINGIKPKKRFLSKDKVVVRDIDFDLVRNAALAAPGLQNLVVNLKDAVSKQADDIKRLQVTEEFLRDKLQHERDEKLRFIEKAKTHDKLIKYLQHEGLDIDRLLQQSEDLHLQTLRREKNKNRSR